MFEVTINTINNPVRPDIVENTTISLRRKEPFLQMAYKYDEDLSKLSDEEAIQKVLDDHYKDTFSDKIQEGKLTELELDLAKLKENAEQNQFQNELTSQAVIELAELLLSNMGTKDEPVEEAADEPESELEDEVPAEESEESEGETDGSDRDADGDENQEQEV